MDLVLDGVHMKTRVAVVLQGQLKEGVVLGKEQLRCWNIRESLLKPLETVDIDGNALELKLSVSGSSERKEIMLRGLIDTGAGLSLMSLEAWKCISTQESYPIQEFSHSV